MVDGVSKVDIYAAPKAVRIEVDIPKLYNLGFTTTNLKYALASSTNMTGAGNLNGPTSHFVLFPETQLSTAEDYEKIVIGFKDGSPIYLRDIAKAINAIQFDTLNINFFNSAVPSDKSTAQIAMGIRKRADGNAIATVAGIKKMLKKFKEELPESITVSEFYDRSELIIANINDVKETLYIAFGLVVLVIFLFLGRIRDTVIPTVALPFSILLTFIFMNAFGFSINNLSLMGLTMAIGFLVDDAIVFLENTVRRMEDFGESPSGGTRIIVTAAKIHAITAIRFFFMNAKKAFPAFFMGFSSLFIFRSALVNRYFPRMRVFFRNTPQSWILTLLLVFVNNPARNISFVFCRLKNSFLRFN